VADATQVPKGNVTKWIAGVLSAVVLLVISLLFNLYQAGMTRQLKNLDGLSNDVRAIQVQIARVETKVDALNTRLEDHIGQ